jgi:glutamine---fructose-6-phosphate transaminase (isomerizing)
MSHGRRLTPFYSEIMDQPAALRRVLDYCAAPEGTRRLQAVPPAHQPLLLGMGASYHAALIAAHQLETLGVSAQALEASDALYGDPARLNRAAPLVYISQSGASGEIAPLLERLAPNQPLVALTNDEASPLAQRAQVVLPLLAGDEQTVATKTYLNSLAVLWLLARHWTGQLDGAAFDALTDVTKRIAGLLARAPALAERWTACLGAAPVYVYIGTGEQAVTARQAAMMTMEWLKVPWSGSRCRR